MTKIQITEVGPRDGLQNETESISVSDKIQFIDLLSQSGLSFIEVGAFVSPQKVPQMAGTSDVFLGLEKNPKVTYSVLVPNEKGMEKALEVGVKKIAVFTAASETFNQKNINTSIQGSIDRFLPVVKMAKENQIQVRAYISTAFVCPYEGDISPDHVLHVVQMLTDLGMTEISLGDTVGRAIPDQVRVLLNALLKKYPSEFFWMHFHDTYGKDFETGTALPNVKAALEFDIFRYDASIGGLGGCPYAPGASGNISTNDLVNFFHEQGFETGIDLNQLNEAGLFIQKVLNRPLASPLIRSLAF